MDDMTIKQLGGVVVGTIMRNGPGKTVSFVCAKLPERVITIWIG